MGHYAHYDAPLACLWVGAVLAFAEAAIDTRTAAKPCVGRRGGAGRSLSAYLLGAAAGTKLTGWLLPLPFLLWTTIYRERKGALTLAVGGAIAAATVYAIVPPWWPAPVEGLIGFFHSNLTRGETTPIRVQFLGTVYVSPNQSLPWYNTLVWTVAASPVGFLFGPWSACARSVRNPGDRFASLAVISWLFLLILRALPHTPAHDGVRQILPAFGALALVSGLGVPERPGRSVKGLISAAILEGAVSIAVMMPVPLSYFSPAVGGLPGATRLGFEPTYYWDTLTPGVLDWLNRETAPGARLRFPAHLFRTSI